MSLLSRESSPMPIPKAPDRLLRPKIDAKPDSPDAHRFIDRQTDVGLRTLRNITDQKAMQYPDEASFINAVDTNEGGLGTLLRIDRLRTQGEGQVLGLGNTPDSIKLEHNLVVKTADDKSVTITEVLGRSGESFRCRTADSEDRPEVFIRRNQLLQAELIADGAELQTILSDPEIKKSDKTVVEGMLAAVKGDTDIQQLEESLKDPTKRQEMEEQLTAAERENGRITDSDLHTLVDKIAPERAILPGATAETIQAVEKSNAERMALIEIISNNNLSIGEKAARILGSDIPFQRSAIGNEIQQLEHRIATASKEDIPALQEKLDEAREFEKVLTAFEKQLNPEPGQTNQFVEMFDSFQDGSLDPATTEAVRLAIQTADIDQVIDTLLPYIPKNIKDQAQREKHAAERKALMKKQGKITMIALLALLAAGAATGGMILKDEQ